MQTVRFVLKRVNAKSRRIQSAIRTAKAESASGKIPVRQVVFCLDIRKTHKEKTIDTV